MTPVDVNGGGGIEATDQRNGGLIMGDSLSVVSDPSRFVDIYNERSHYEKSDSLASGQPQLVP